MLNKVTLCENALDPASWTTHECDDVRRFLVDHFGTWPDTAKIYLNRVGQDTDVTPFDEGSVERLGKLNGHFFVVVYPAHISALAVLIISISLSAASIAIGYLLRPSLPENQQSQSPTNSLTNRENKERLGERILDFYGVGWVTPDLIGVPWRTFIGNKEVEHMVLCIGRGAYDIAEARDSVTPMEQIDGAGIAFWAPYTSSLNGDAPQLSIGSPINAPIMNIKKYDSVNGQTLKAPNANKFKASNNVRFTDAGVVEGTGDVDFTDYFEAGSTANPKYLVISNSSYDGRYLILDVTTTQIVLSNPGSVNAAWNSLSGETDWGSPTLLNSGDNWEGPFYIIDNTLAELRCNFVAMQGLYKLDSKGNQHAVDVTVQIEVTSIDSEYNEQGSHIYAQATLKGSNTFRTMCGEPLNVILPVAGSCKIRARRLTNTDLRDGYNVVDQVQWRDLYGASPVLDDAGNPMTHFGNVTTIQTITWPTPQALSIKQRKINVKVGRKLHREISETLVVEVPATAAPWTFDDGINSDYPFDDYEHTTDPVVIGNLIPGDSLSISATGTVTHDSGWIFEDADGDLSSYESQKDSHQFPVEYVSGKDIGTCGLCGAFTDENGIIVEIVRIGKSETLIVPDGAAQLQLGVNDDYFSDNSGNFAVTIIHESTDQSEIATINAADILCNMALDPYIGRRTESEIDREEIYAVLGSGGEAETYFGCEYCNQFSYGFDDKNMSFEEMVGQLCQAVFCQGYRRGNVLTVKLEKETDDSLLLFNHRNKLPGSESRTVKFGTATENDGIELTYVEPNAPNAQNVDSSYTLYFPEDQSATSPKKITAIGVRNRVQAWILGWRLYQKLLYQNQVTQFDATSEAGLCVISDRILVADNTRSDTQDGEVIGQVGLEIELSQPVTYASPAPNYTIFLQAYDGTVEAIAITPGSADNKVVLASAPSVALVTDAAKYARTTYMIVSDEDQSTSAFLLQEKDAKDGGTYGIKAVNYDSRYYDHDQDYSASPRVVDLLTPGDGVGAGYSAQASASVFVESKTMPWVPSDNPTYDYGIEDGKQPVAVPIQAAEGETVAITANAPGEGALNQVMRSDEGDLVGAEGEPDYITGDTSDSHGYWPTKYTTDKSLGRCGLIGAWAVNNGDGTYAVVEPFVIGYGGNFTVPTISPSPGIDTLLLGINDNKFSDNNGGFQVLVTQTGVAAGAAAAVDLVPDNTTTDPNATTYTITVNGA